jgi:hypothetical protein
MIDKLKLKIELSKEKQTMIALSKEEATMIGFNILAGLENSAIDPNDSNEDLESYNTAKGILMKMKNICSEECKRKIEDYIEEMEIDPFAIDETDIDQDEEEYLKRQDELEPVLPNAIPRL